MLAESNSISLFRKRDIGILVIVLISIYLSYFDAPSLNYVIEPAWFIDQNDVPSPLPPINYKLIPPIITDLEGDGTNEVILVTTDFKLKIFFANIPSLDMTDVYHPEEISSTDLSEYIQKSLKSTSIPIALRTGYVEPYKVTESRSQVIIVVFDDLTVVCFDSFLNEKWEKKVAHHTLNLEWNIFKYRINEVSVYIAPLQINENASNGVVIVGASWMKIDNQQQGEEDADRHLKLALNKSYIEIEHEERMIESQLSHFSVYALDSISGHILWKHDGQEIRSEQYSKSLPQHAYSLDVKDLMAKTHHAPGINDWTVFRRSLIDELPHSWYSEEHTSMRIAHFIRRHIGAGQELHKPHAHAHRKTSKEKKIHHEITSGKGRNGKQATKLSSLPILQGEIKTKGIEASATLPHNAEEHTKNPNVIVIHTKHGLEIIALRTGIPVTSLALSPDRVYADVDGDGVVDAITILDSPERVKHHESEYVHHQYEFSNVKLQHCMMVVMSGLPSRSQLFNGSVCQDRPSLKDSLKHISKEDSRWNHKTKVSPRLIPGDDYPAIVHSVPLILHKMNPDTEKESKIRDIIVYTHHGVVTSYSGTGNFNWQIKNGPKWSSSSNADIESESEKIATPIIKEGLIQAFDSDAQRVSSMGYHNNMYSSILLTGETTIQIISRDGDELANAEIPRPPISQPILGDFDNDGVTDMIIVTDGAILGYHVHVVQANRVVFILLVLLVIFALFAFLLNVQTISSAILDETSHSPLSQQNMQLPSIPQKAPKSKAYTLFHIIRSTDEQHLD